MDAVLTEFVVQYGKLEEETESVVTALIGAAETYLAGAGISPETAAPALYNLAVAGIVSHWHENRAAVDQSSPKDFEPGIRLIINQLKRDSQIVDATSAMC